MFFAGKASAADGRERRADPSGFMAFFLVLFLSQKEKERKKKEEKPRKIFFAGKVSFADGRKQRLFPGQVPGFLFWFSFLSPERKENVNIHRKERGKRFRKEKAGASDTALTPAHGAPNRIRTCGLPLRRRSLYPAEL